MKVTELDTKEVKVTRTETRYVLNEKVFQLDSCPFWAQYAAVDACGKAYWYSAKPSRAGSDWVDFYGCIRLIRDGDNALIFDATDWQHSLIERPRKVLEITMADLERKYGCKVKIVKEAQV